MEDANITAAVPAPRKERAKPELVQVGNRYIISSGRWNDERIIEYVMTHGQDKWIPIGDLARVAWGQNIPTNRRRVRAYLGRLWKLLMLKEGRLLSVEYAVGNHHPAQAVKIYDPKNNAECATLQAKIDKLLRSKELSEDLHAKAIALLSPSEEEAA
jgi:hypothetical protein